MKILLIFLLRKKNLFLTNKKFVYLISINKLFWYHPKITYENIVQKDMNKFIITRRILDRTLKIYIIWSSFHLVIFELINIVIHLQLRACVVNLQWGENLYVVAFGFLTLKVVGFFVILYVQKNQMWHKNIKVDFSLKQLFSQYSIYLIIIELLFL